MYRNLQLDGEEYNKKYLWGILLQVRILVRNSLAQLKNLLSVNINYMDWLKK